MKEEWQGTFTCIVACVLSIHSQSFYGSVRKGHFSRFSGYPKGVFLVRLELRKVPYFKGYARATQVGLTSEKNGSGTYIRAIFKWKHSLLVLKGMLLWNFYLGKIMSFSILNEENKLDGEQRIIFSGKTQWYHVLRPLVLGIKQFFS